MSAFPAALLRLPAARLARSRRVLASLGFGALAAVAFALVLRASAPLVALDRALLVAFAQVALPVGAFTIVRGVLAGGSVGAAGAPLRGYGGAPVAVALSHVAVAVAASCAYAAALAAALVAASGGGSLANDYGPAVYAAVLGGAAYAALFAFEGTFTFGRGIALAVDFVAGNMGSLARRGSGASGHDAWLAVLTPRRLLALVCPRGHVLALLGGGPKHPVSARASGAVLLALALAFTALVALRARPSRVRFRKKNAA